MIGEWPFGTYPRVGTSTFTPASAPILRDCARSFKSARLTPTASRTRWDSHALEICSLESYTTDRDRNVLLGAVLRTSAAIASFRTHGRTHQLLEKIPLLTIPTSSRSAQVEVSHRFATSVERSRSRSRSSSSSWGRHCRVLRAADMVDESDYSQYEKVAFEAAQAAGKVIAAAFDEIKLVEHKGVVDLVTATDRQCEELIFKHIRNAFASHEFIGEEGSSLTGTADLTDAPTWMVDPLDGTTNFVHRFPFVCVSIALVVKKQPIVGVVYNPILNEFFSAVRGKGAYLNGKRIYVSTQDRLEKGLLATEIGTKRDKLTVDATTDQLNSLIFKVRSLRLSGSCACNLAGVACGRLDMFYERGFGGPWDVAAGALLVEEAGGKVFDPNGGPFNVMARRVAASNAFLETDFSKALNNNKHGGEQKAQL